MNQRQQQRAGADFKLFGLHTSSAATVRRRPVRISVTDRDLPYGAQWQDHPAKRGITNVAVLEKGASCRG